MAVPALGPHWASWAPRRSLAGAGRGSAEGNAPTPTPWQSRPFPRASSTGTLLPSVWERQERVGRPSGRAVMTQHQERTVFPFGTGPAGPPPAPRQVPHPPPAWREGAAPEAEELALGGCEQQLPAPPPPQRPTCLQGRGNWDGEGSLTPTDKRSSGA